MYLKILIILFSLLYQNTAHSKATEKNQFNQKYLSNYFSALVSVTNQKNDDAIIFGIIPIILSFIEPNKIRNIIKIEIKIIPKDLICELNKDCNILL